MVGGDFQQGETPRSGYAQDRDRLIAAISKAAAEHGYADLTVEQVLAYAKVSREIFDIHFDSKEQGLVAAQEAFFERLWLEAAHACDESEEWPQKVRAGLSAILDSVVEGSSLARVFAVEAITASFAVAERQFETIDGFARLLRFGRERYPAAKPLPELTERALIGGIVSIVSGHLLREDPQAIALVEAQLVELLLIPYLGAEEARRVAQY